jgi:hypothetical protein
MHVSGCVCVYVSVFLSESVCACLYFTIYNESLTIHNINHFVPPLQCCSTSESSDGELPINRELGRLSEEESHQEAVVSKTAREGSGRRRESHEEKGWFRYIKFLYIVSFFVSCICYLSYF